MACLIWGHRVNRSGFIQPAVPSTSHTPGIWKPHIYVNEQQLVLRCSFGLMCSPDTSRDQGRASRGGRGWIEIS